MGDARGKACAAGLAMMVPCRLGTAVTIEYAKSTEPGKATLVRLKQGDFAVACAAISAPTDIQKHAAQTDRCWHWLTEKVLRLPRRTLLMVGTDENCKLTPPPAWWPQRADTRDTSPQADLCETQDAWEHAAGACDQPMHTPNLVSFMRSVLRHGLTIANVLNDNTRANLFWTTAQKHRKAYADRLRFG